MFTPPATGKNFDLEDVSKVNEVGPNTVRESEGMIPHPKKSPVKLGTNQ